MSPLEPTGFLFRAIILWVPTQNISINQLILKFGSFYKDNKQNNPTLSLYHLLSQFYSVHRSLICVLQLLLNNLIIILLILRGIFRLLLSVSLIL